MTVLVGSRHEGYGETGMAHLLEHMVFKGTPTHPDMPKALQERGAAVQRHHLGATAPTTTRPCPPPTRTSSSPSQLEADRLVNSFIKREDLLDRDDRRPQRVRAGENCPPSILDPAHDGRRLRVAQLRQVHHRQPQPTSSACRSTVCRPSTRSTTSPITPCSIVAGKFDEAKALELVAKYFGALQAARPRCSTRPTPRSRPRTASGSSPCAASATVGVVGRGLPHPGRGPRRLPAVEVLAERRPDAAPTGRLYKALVETKKATSVSGLARRVSRPRRPGDPRRRGATPPRIDAARDALVEPLEWLPTQPITDEEVARVAARHAGGEPTGTRQP